ncbi:MAG: translocation/assembly module TamB domain-containing protein [Bacteroidota bacterium]
MDINSPDKHIPDNSLNPVDQNSTGKRTLWQKTRRFFSVLLVTFLILFVLFSLIIRLPGVQNYLAGKVTGWLSAQLETTVKVDYVDIDFFDKLVLDGFLVLDHESDTLLYAGELKADISTFSLFSNKLMIDQLILNDGQFNLVRYKPEDDTNLAILLNRLNNGSTSKKERRSNQKKKAWLLGVDKISLNEINTHVSDSRSGDDMVIELPSARFNIKKIDLEELLLEVASVVLEGPKFYYTKYERGLPREEPSIEDLLLDEDELATDSTAKSFLALIDKIDLTDGVFHYDNAKNPAKPPPGMDFNHIHSSNINLDVSDFSFQDGISKGWIESLSASEKSGFVLEKLSGNTTVSGEMIEVSDMELLTQNSYVRDYYRMTFSSFNDFDYFSKSVFLRGEFKKANVAISDIMYFAPELRENEFFLANENEVLVVDGSFSGRMRKLKGKDLRVQIGNTIVKGRFDSRDIVSNEDAFWEITVDEMQSSMNEIQLLVPQMQLPDNFEKLGNLNFNGSFIGFLSNFVADGNLNSDVGVIKTDIKLDLTNGNEVGEYSGALEVVNFDLGKWTGDDQFGKITFRSDIAGNGIVVDKINARLDGKVESFVFKDYNYQNLAIDGVFQSRLFEGELIAKDENIDLNFNGTINFNEELPVFNLTAELDTIRFQKLNLLPKPLDLSGTIDFDFFGDNIDNIQGKASFFDFHLANKNNTFQIDSVLINSYIDTVSGVREINLNSEVAEARMAGYFDLLLLKDAFVEFVEDHYPKYADKIDFSTPPPVFDTLVVDDQVVYVERPSPINKQDFTFDIKVKKANNLPQFFNIFLGDIGTANLTGYFNTEKGWLTVGGTFPKISVANVVIEDLILRSSTKEDRTDLTLRVGGAKVGKNIELPPLFYSGELVKDTLNFSVNVSNLTDIFTDLNLNGVLFPEDDYFQASILPSNFYIYNRKWDISGDNFIRFNQDFVKTKNVKLTHEEEIIALNGIGERGLMLNLVNISTDPINDLVNNPNLIFNGNISADIQADDVFKLEGLEVNASIDSFFINDFDTTDVIVHAKAANLKSILEAKVKVFKDGKSVLVDGTYISPLAAMASNLDNANYFDVRVTTESFPLNLAENFLREEISETVGEFNANLRVNGLPKKPNISGSINILGGATKVNYLQTTYFLDNITSRVDNFNFWLNNNFVRDENNRMAEVFGSITHDHLSDFRLNLEGRTIDRDFLLMNTTKEDNPDFYGMAKGNAYLKFTGPFNQIDLFMSATSSEGTEISIPLDGNNAAKEVSFIEFVKPDTSETTTRIGTAEKLRGVSVELEMDINQQADIILIFDERAGEIINGNGNGNIKIVFTRTGEFTMNGGYTIEEGDYLFSYQNFIKKPFAVKRGGTIRWDGDPYDAQISLDAYYKGLKTPVYNFISDYLLELEGTAAYAAAQRSTSVNLLMHLENSLLKPDITFDIEFPTIDPELRGYVDSKLQSIRDDDNEINRQVFGLIVLGNFLPSISGAAQTGNNQFVTGINTLSELLSNQLSVYLSDLLSELVDGAGFISNIDFDFDYRLIQSNAGINIDNPATASQVQLGLKNYFLDNRLIVNIGGNIDFANGASSIGNGPNNGAYVAGDFVIEYLITADGRFRIRAYNRTESGFEELDGSQRNRTGIGISYSTEFDTFREFIDSFFGRFGKKKKRNVSATSGID